MLAVWDAATRIGGAAAQQSSTVVQEQESRSGRSGRVLSSPDEGASRGRADANSDFCSSIFRGATAESCPSSSERGLS